VPYFHSGKETCSLMCHIFMADLLLGVPCFYGGSTPWRAMFLWRMWSLMYHDQLRSCSLACHIFIAEKKPVP
jgi:hypothetical protein